MSGLFEDDDYVIEGYENNRPRYDGVEQPLTMSNVKKYATKKDEITYDVRNDDNSVYGGSLDIVRKMQHDSFEGVKTLPDGTTVRKRSTRELYAKTRENMSQTVNLNEIFKKEHNIADLYDDDVTDINANPSRNYVDAYAGMPVDESGVPITNANTRVIRSSGVEEAEVNLTDDQIRERISRNTVNPNMVNIKSEIMSEDEYIDDLIKTNKSDIDYSNYTGDDLYDDETIDENAEEDFEKINENAQNTIKNEENEPILSENSDISEEIPTVEESVSEEEYEDELVLLEAAPEEDNDDELDFTEPASMETNDELEDIAESIGLQLDNEEVIEEKKEEKPVIKVKKVFNKESLKSLNNSED